MTVVVGRTRKYLGGLWRARAGLAGVEAAWWTRRFDGRVSDVATIAPGRSDVATALHYRSVEQLLHRDLRRRGIDLDGRRVLDVGAGAGHWTAWALDRGAKEVTAVDVSRPVVDHLRARWEGDARVDVVAGTATDAVGPFDAVLAVGVMFHITDDDEWAAAIRHFGAATEAGGWLAVTGMLGRLGHSDVQVVDGRITKRMRPYRRWRRELEAAGFRDIRLVRNRAWLRASEPLPEAHLLTGHQLIP